MMLLGDDENGQLWDEVVRQKDKLQESLQDKGRLLYLTKRVGYNGASLFIHLKDQGIIADLVTEQLSKIKGVSRGWAVPLYRPRFFPLPKDTHNMKRFVVTLKIAPAHLGNAYKRLLNPNVPDGLKKVYYAFTFQMDNVLQISLLADKDETINKYVAEELNAIKGVLKVNVYPIEKTKPFITYDEWQSYAGEKVHHPRWKNMLTHIEGWDI